MIYFDIPRIPGMLAVKFWLWQSQQQKKTALKT